MRVFMPLGAKDERMKPQAEVAGDDRGTGGGESDFDTWRALQRVVDKKRADIIADIVGHPKGAPTVEELDYMNPPLSEDSIRRHLKTLADVGVVRVREFETGNRVRDYPYQFFEITSKARELFDQNGLFPEEAWRRQYAAVEKTSRIEEVESMPRPNN